MPAFEPSTWAEVEEALASRTSSAQNTNSFVARVRAFTDAPERFTFRPQTSVQPTVSSLSAPDAVSSDGDEPNPPTGRAPDVGRKPARIPLTNLKRCDGQFDDLLGLGRVDAESESLVRRYVTNPNMDEVNIVPVSTTGCKVSNSSINPASESFDPHVYLARVHKMSSLEELSRGREALAELRKRFSAEAERLRKQEYVSAALVEAAFQSAKQSVDLGNSEGPLGSPAEAAVEFSKAEALLRERYSEVIRREATLTRLRRTLGIYTRYQWIFKLGQRLRSAASEGPGVIEEVMKEYHRGMKWVEAQDDEGLSPIEKDISGGFNFLVNSIFVQLSTKNQSRQETQRLVAILTCLKKDDLLTEALATRMRHATDGLWKLKRAKEAALESTERVQREMVGQMVRANGALIDGLSHMWQLGRILRKQERWREATDENITQCCEAYCEMTKEILLSGASLSREPVRELVLVLTKTKEDLQIPASCLAPLTKVNREVSEQFLNGICSSVSSKAEQMISQAVQARFKTGSDVARRLAAVLMEGLEEVEESLVHRHEAADERTSNGHVDEKDVDSEEGDKREAVDMKTSGVTRVGIRCAEIPGAFAEQLYKLLEGENHRSEGFALKVAVCCAELSEEALAAVRKRSGARSAFDTRSVLAVLAESEDQVGRTLTRATTRYVSIVCKPLQSLVAGMISPSTTSGTGPPIKTAAVSRHAAEMALQIALVAISVRRASGNSNLLRAILIAVVHDIGAVLGAADMPSGRAAQLWVDVTYLEETVTRGAGAETAGLDKALDGFGRAKEKAVGALQGAGESFGATDRGVLRETAVGEGVKRGGMVQQVFREAWDAVRGDE